MRKCEEYRLCRSKTKETVIIAEIETIRRKSPDRMAQTDIFTGSRGRYSDLQKETTDQKVNGAKSKAAGHT